MNEWSKAQREAKRAFFRFLELERKDSTVDMESFILEQPHEVQEELHQMLSEFSQLRARSSWREFKPFSQCRIGEYELSRFIGVGGMGEVWEATNVRESGQKCALKMLFPHLTFSPRAVHRFELEAAASMRLSHPNIVRTLSFGELSGVLYIAQELIDHGTNLSHYLESSRSGNRNPLAYFRETAFLFMKIAAALHYAHRKGVVHQDIKPSNILLTKELKPKLADFGLARIEGEPDLTRIGEVVGTLYYLSPEQALGQRIEIDHRTDIFSLGATLFEALTRRRAFDGESSEQVLERIVFHEAVDPTDLVRSIPYELSAICLRALQKRKELRYPDMLEMALDLRRYLSTRAIAAKNESHRAHRLRMPTRKPLDRKLVPLWLLAAGLLVIVGHLTFTAAARQPLYETALADLKEPLPEYLATPLDASAFQDYVLRRGATRGISHSEPKILFPRGGIVTTKPDIRISLGDHSTSYSRKGRIRIVDPNGGIPAVIREFRCSAGQSEIVVPPLSGESLPPGIYMLRFELGELDGKEAPGTLRAACIFAIFSESQVAEICEAAPRTGNTFLDRHLLAAELLDAKAEGRYQAGLAQLALKRLGDSPSTEASPTIHAIHLLLKARALEILGRSNEVRQVHEAWARISTAKESAVNDESTSKATAHAARKLDRFVYRGGISLDRGEVEEEHLELEFETVRTASKEPLHRRAQAIRAHGFSTNSLDSKTAKVVLSGGRGFSGDSIGHRYSFPTGFPFIGMHLQSFQLNWNDGVAPATLTFQERIGDERVSSKESSDLSSGKNRDHLSLEAHSRQGATRTGASAGLLSNTEQAGLARTGALSPEKIWRMVAFCSLVHIARYGPWPPLSFDAWIGCVKAKSSGSASWLRMLPDLSHLASSSVAQKDRERADGFRTEHMNRDAVTRTPIVDELREEPEATTLVAGERSHSPVEESGAEGLHGFAMAGRRYSRVSDCWDLLPGSRNELRAVCNLSGRVPGKGQPVLPLSDQTTLSPECPDAAISLNKLALLYQARGHFTEAESIFERALANTESLLGSNHPAVASNLNNLALLHHDQGRYATAMSLYERALAIRESTLGSEHPNVAASLNNLARALHGLGRYSESKAVCERALEICESSLDPEHPDVATSLNNLAELYYTQGRYAESKPLYERALEIRESLFGPNHYSVAECLSNLARLYMALGCFGESEPLYERALAIYESSFGSQHSDVAESLNDLAELYHAQGRYAESEAHCKRALAIRESALGSHHPAVARSLHKLATLHRIQGRSATAVPLYERALAIHESVLGSEHPDVAESLNNLAELYRAQGRYKRSESLYERALEIREAALGPEHPDVATCLSNLAALYHAQGRYAESEPLYKRALAIYKSSLGSEHPYVATSLSDLAKLYDAQGRYSESEPLYKRALAIYELSLGSGHPSVAKSLCGLGGLCFAQSRYAESERLYERALAIYKSSLGSEHPYVATNLNDLAKLYVAQGRYPESEVHSKRALEIRKSSLGSGHPSVAESLYNLAEIYRAQGRYAESEPLYERALEIRVTSLGPHHPLVAESLSSLAELYMIEGRHAESRLLYERALRATLDYLDREFPVLSEADRFRLLGRTKGRIGMLASIAKLECKDTGHAFDLCLEWKGKVTRLQAASLELSQREDDPEIHAKFGTLQELQKQLSELVMLPQRSQEPDFGERIAALRRKRLMAERELNRDLGLDEMFATPTGRELQAAMPPDSVLLDFHVGEDVFAWVLHSTGEPELIALGEASALRGQQEFILLESLTRGGRGSSVSAKPGADLNQLLWEPLREAVGDARTVFLSPDGFLCELPFEVLLDREGHYLLERHRFIYLSDATRLASFDEAAEDREGPVLAVGDVDYFQAEEVKTNGFQGLRSGIGHRWELLPSTRDELRWIRRLHEEVLEWDQPLQELSGKSATEEAIRRSIAGQRYVHIATHGYFKPDRLLFRMCDAEQKSFEARTREQIDVIGVLPGLLSGLVFAGANANPEPGRDDGYLSADEIQRLDLSSCDLAVLSACETALGSERAGEGLMSLRRAFEVAGAKAVVSSLWKIDDQATAALMKWFYENLWLHGMEKNEALHQAKLRMLRQNREAFEGDARPSTWGAFILSGDWR